MIVAVVIYHFLTNHKLLSKWLRLYGTGSLRLFLWNLRKGGMWKKQMKKTRPRLIGLKQHNRKQTNKHIHIRLRRDSDISHKIKWSNWSSATHCMALWDSFAVFFFKGRERGIKKASCSSRYHDKIYVSGHLVWFMTDVIFSCYLFLKVNRMIDVDFNSLEANLNLQTWVIVLEFFGIGVPQQPLSSQPSSPSATSSQSNPLDNALDGKQLPMEIEGT